MLASHHMLQHQTHSQHSFGMPSSSDQKVETTHLSGFVCQVVIGYLSCLLPLAHICQVLILQVCNQLLFPGLHRIHKLQQIS